MDAKEHRDRIPGSYITHPSSKTKANKSLLYCGSSLPEEFNLILLKKKKRKRYHEKMEILLITKYELLQKSMLNSRKIIYLSTMQHFRSLGSLEELPPIMRSRRFFSHPYRWPRSTMVSMTTMAIMP